MPDVNRPAASPVVLLLEDNALLRAALFLALEREGFTMRSAATVREALIRLAEEPAIAVVVLEIDLGPGTPRGFAFADVALARRPDLRLVFLTGRADLLVGRAHGPREMHLTKPCPVPRVAAAIRRVLDGA